VGSNENFKQKLTNRFLCLHHLKNIFSIVDSVRRRRKVELQEANSEKVCNKIQIQEALFSFKINISTPVNEVKILPIPTLR